MEADIQGVNLNIQKEIQFHTIQGVSKLTIQNPSPHKLGLKIRTNHKTALNIHPTHDFLDPNSKKDIIVKLMQVHQNVKLQVNYAIATQEMLAKNDSKMTNVDKKYIKKEIIAINVSDVKNTAVPEQQKSKQHSLDLNTSFSTVVPQKSQESTKPSIQKKTSLTSSINLKQTAQMVVTEQKQQEQSCERQQKIKTLRSSIQQTQNKTTQKRKQIMDKKQQLSMRTNDDSFVNPLLLPLFVIAAFFVGSFIKAIIF